MTDRFDNLRALRDSKRLADRAGTAAEETSLQLDRQVDVAKQAASAVTAEGKARVAALKAQGWEVVQDINSQWGRFSGPYLETLGSELREYTDEITKYTGINEAMVRNVIKHRDDAQGLVFGLMGEITGEAEDLQEDLQDLSDQIEALEGEARAQIVALYKELEEDFTEIAQETGAYLKEWALENLKPIQEWFTENVVTPVFGEGEGIISTFKDIAEKIAPMLAKLQGAFVYMKIFMKLMGGIQKMRDAAYQRTLAQHNHIFSDFQYQRSRWQALMQASGARTGVVGHRLPSYERVFRFRRFQAAGNMGAQIGTARALQPLKGEESGGVRYPSTSMWYALSNLQQDQVARTFLSMGWGDDVPTKDDERVRADLSNLFRGWQEGPDHEGDQWRDLAFPRWPSRQWTYRVNTGKMFNRYIRQRTPGDTVNRGIIWTPDNHWPMIQPGSIADNDALPDRSPRNKNRYRWGGVGIPEIPFTEAHQVPTVYWVFWFARHNFNHNDLLRRWEEVAYAMRNEYAHAGYIPPPPGTGDILAPRGRSWMDLRTIDFIPLLTDAQWTQANLILPTSGGRAKDDPVQMVASMFGMSGSISDPKQSLTAQGYGEMMEFVTANRGPDGLREIRSVEYQKSPAIQTAIEWSKAILAGSPEAKNRARELAQKAGAGTATDEELAYLTALNTAMYGIAPPDTVEGR